MIDKPLMLSVLHYNDNVMHAAVKDTGIVIGRLKPNKPNNPPRSIRYAMYTNKEGRNKQFAQRADASLARAEAKGKRATGKKRNSKDALKEARAEQDVRRFEKDAPVEPPKVSRATTSANDELKAWSGAQDPFGLTSIKRRKPV